MRITRNTPPAYYVRANRNFSNFVKYFDGRRYFSGVRQGADFAVSEVEKMNFLTTIFFVILTSGIHNVHAGWPEDRKRLVIHFGTFIQSLQNIAKRECRESQKVEEIKYKNPAGLYTLIEGNSTVLQYVQRGQDLNEFSYYTMERISYLINTNTISKMQLLGTIRTLANDINLDSELGWEYKYDKMPLRAKLLNIILSEFNGNYEDFNAVCPDSPS